MPKRDWEGPEPYESVDYQVLCAIIDERVRKGNINITININTNININIIGWNSREEEDEWRGNVNYTRLADKLIAKKFELQLAKEDQRMEEWLRHVTHGILASVVAPEANISESDGRKKCELEEEFSLATLRQDINI